MVIAWNGDVLPCTCVEGNEYVMGNLLKESLEEVWNGPQFRKSREFVLNYGPEQNTGSVCERLSCPVTDKKLTPTAEPAGVAGRRSLAIIRFEAGSRSDAGGSTAR
jgi:radical SAM protein with 4Fe4S-binding SPASM domain